MNSNHEVWDHTGYVEMEKDERKQNKKKFKNSNQNQQLEDDFYYNNIDLNFRDSYNNNEEAGGSKRYNKYHTGRGFKKEWNNNQNQGGYNNYNYNTGNYRQQNFNEEEYFNTLLTTKSNSSHNPTTVANDYEKYPQGKYKRKAYNKGYDNYNNITDDFESATNWEYKKNDKDKGMSDQSSKINKENNSDTKFINEGNPKGENSEIVDQGLGQGYNKSGKISNSYYQQNSKASDKGAGKFQGSNFQNQRDIQKSSNYVNPTNSISNKQSITQLNDFNNKESTSGLDSTIISNSCADNQSHKKAESHQFANSQLKIESANDISKGANSNLYNMQNLQIQKSENFSNINNSFTQEEIMYGKQINQGSGINNGSNQAFNSNFNIPPVYQYPTGINPMFFGQQPNPIMPGTFNNNQRIGSAYNFPTYGFNTYGINSKPGYSSNSSIPGHLNINQSSSYTPSSLNPSIIGNMNMNMIVPNMSGIPNIMNLGVAPIVHQQTHTTVNKSSKSIQNVNDMASSLNAYGNDSEANLLRESLQFYSQPDEEFVKLSKVISNKKIIDYKLQMTANHESNPNLNLIKKEIINYKNELKEALKRVKEITCSSSRNDEELISDKIAVLSLSCLTVYDE